MDQRRSDRSMTVIVWLTVLCGVGVFWTVPTAHGERRTGTECERTYAPDVQCGMPVIRPAGLPKHQSEAVRGEFPWHVAIVLLESGIPVYSCGGSLVSDRFVLTAAHCVVNANNGFPQSRDVFRVQAGYHELHHEVAGCTQELTVNTVYVHPEFRSGSHRHDLALLELQRVVRFNDRVLPVCLDRGAEDATGEFYRRAGKVPGWGYTELDDVSSWLRMTEVPIVNYTRCLTNNPDSFYQAIHDGMFCGGYANGTNVCNGDSGGGLVTYRDGRWELQGIVSFTGLREGALQAVCDTRQYAGFVKVRYYKAWIDSILTGDWEWATDDDDAETNANGDSRPSGAPGGGNGSDALEPLRRKAACGERKISTVPLIVNGVRSFAGQWPWHAAVFGVSKRSREYLCGGTLVSPGYILTAAACASDWHPRKRPLVVQLGQTELWQASTTGREVRVLGVETSEDSTMALLRLEQDVQYDDHIQPICLPTPTPDSVTGADGTGRNGTVAGYGQTDPSGPPSPVLHATVMPVVDSGMCLIYRIFDSQEANKMFCVGLGNGTNACKGDEGGGFYEEDERGVWTLTGVIGKINLYRKQCDPYGYVGLSDVRHYLEWIVERIRSALSLPAHLTDHHRHRGKQKKNKKGCRRKHQQDQHRRRGGSGESDSGEGSNESRERSSITASVKNVVQAKVDLVKDIHGAAKSTIKKIFG